MIEVERPLELKDLEELLAAPKPSVPEGHRAIANIRYAHHQLARLLAEGTDQEEIALITGYSPAYISVVKADPAFKELLAYYENQKREIFVDVLERRKTLGLLAIEELTQRMTDEPEKMANRELMELHDMAFGKIGSADSGSGGKAPAVAIAVSFVGPQVAPLPPLAPQERQIEGSLAIASGDKE